MAVAVRPPHVEPDAWQASRRVLCVRADGMGDVLMTGPAIRALAGSGPPDRTITVLASRAGAAAAAMLPGVDHVIVSEPPWTAAGLGGVDDGAIVEVVRRGDYDAAAIFTVCTQSALPAAMLLLLAGVPRRLAFARENPYRLLTDWIPEPEPDGPTRHEVERQLAMVAAVGASSDDDLLHVRLPPHARVRAAGILRALGIAPGEPWLPIFPGASAPSRRYPPAAFAAAADALAGRGWRIVLVGAAADHAAIDEVQWTMGRAAAFLPQIPLESLAALLSRAPVVVTNNTGPAHLAAAVGTPVVDLYALTNPQHTPWGVERRVLFHDVPCRGCARSICPEGHHACLRGVPPDDVVRAVEELSRPPETVHAARALFEPVTA